MSKEESRQIFESFFGDKEEIYLNKLGFDQKHWLKDEKPIKKKDIINPSPKIYIKVRKVLFAYKDIGAGFMIKDKKGNLHETNSFARYNCFLMLRAIMEKSISDIKYNDWLGKYPILQKLDNE